MNQRKNTNPKSVVNLRAYGLAFIGIVMFSITLPMTRIAVAQMSPVFVSFGRAAIAGLLAICVLTYQRAALPRGSDWGWLLGTIIGVVFGFPLFSSIAMKSVAAAHGAIITGLLPLATIIAGAILVGERPSVKFWIWASLGSALVICFALLRGGGQPVSGDWAMIAAILLGALGYACGGHLSKKLGGIHTICWALVFSLPINLLVASLTWEQQYLQANLMTWVGLGYVSIFSMFVGFFFWYGGLALGGIAKIGQVQLIQPFLTVSVAAWINHEPFEMITVLFALGVILTVAMGRKSLVASDRTAHLNANNAAHNAVNNAVNKAASKAITKL